MCVADMFHVSQKICERVQQFVQMINGLGLLRTLGKQTRWVDLNSTLSCYYYQVTPTLKNTTCSTWKIYISINYVKCFYGYEEMYSNFIYLIKQFNQFKQSYYSI